MSATAAFGTGKARHRPPSNSSVVIRGFVLVTIALAISILLVGAVTSPDQFLDPGWGLAMWLAAVAVVGVASVPFEGGQQLGLDMPILLSAGYLFGPFAAGTLAFVGYVDARELHGEIPLTRALFNRAQTSLSVMAATAAFMIVGGQTAEWPLAMLAALLAVGTDCVVNFGTVVAALSLHEGIGLTSGLSRLSFGSFPSFALTYLSFGLLSMMLAEIYTSVGSWSLAVFALPVLLARQAFAGHGNLERAQRQVEAQTDALLDVSSAMADERRQERLALAAGLHDEVLPPIYKVHLMGQVLRQDLASGQLLALEEDLPELLLAAEDASESTRSLMRALRDSPLGAGGLPGTLRLLVEYLQKENDVRIRLQCDEAGGTPLVQLLAYQVVREALRNSLRHSSAQEVSVVVCSEKDNLRVVVEDKGIGFDPDAVDPHSHFGLSLMRERVELAGGVLRVDSRPGEGTRVVARLPITRIARAI